MANWSIEMIRFATKARRNRVPTLTCLKFDLSATLAVQGNFRKRSFEILVLRCLCCNIVYFKQNEKANESQHEVQSQTRTKKRRNHN